MAGEVVGSVYVRVRALTDKLASDIQTGISKGIAGVDPHDGSDLGGELAGEFAEGFEDAAEKVLPSSTARAFKKAAKKASPDVKKEGKGLGDLFARAVSTGTDKHILELSKKLNKSFSALQKAMKPLALSGKTIVKALAVPLVAKALIALGQYVMVLVGQIGFIITAAAGAAYAMLGAFLSAAAGVGVLAVAFKKKTPQLEAFTKVAKEVGTALQDEIAIPTQKAMLPALTRALKLFKQLGPRLGSFGAVAGGAFGDMVEGFAKFLTSGAGLDRFNKILAGSGPIFKSLTNAARAFLEIVINVWTASIPIATRFSASLDKMLTRWAAITGLGADNGVLEFKLGVWYDRAEQFGKALADLTVGLWNMLNVGGTSAQPFMDTFSNFTAMFRVWTTSEEGQNRIKEIFDNARASVHEVNQLLADIIRLISAPLREEQGGIAGFLSDIRTNVLPFIETQFLPKIKELKEPLLELANVVLDLVVKLAELGTLDKLISMLTLTLEVLTKLLSIPGLGAFIGFLSSFAIALSLLSTLAKPFIAVFKILASPAVLGVITKLVAALPALGTVLQVLGSAIAAAFGLAVSPAIALVIGIAAVVAAIIAVVAAVKNWDKIKEWASKAWQAIQVFWDWLLQKIPEVARGLWEWASEAASKVPGLLGDLVAKAKEKFLDLIGKAKQLGVDILAAVVQWASELPGKIGTALGDFASKVIEKMGDLGGKLKEWFIAAAKAAPGAIADLLKAIVSALVTLPADIAAALVNAATSLVDWILDAAPKIAGFMGQFLGKLVGFIVGIPLIVAALLIRGAVELVKWIVDAAQKFGPKFLEFSSKVVSAIADFVKALPGNIIGAIVAITSWISDARETASEKLREFVEGFFIQVGLFVVELPSKFVNAAKALWSWIKDAIPEAGRKLGEFGTSIFNWFFTFITVTLPEIIKDLPSTIWDWVTDAVDLAGEKLGALVTSITTWLGDLPTKLAEAAKSAGEAFASSFIGGFTDMLKSLPGGQAVLDGLNSILDYENPFTSTMNHVHQTAGAPTAAGALMAHSLAPVAGATAASSPFRQFGLSPLNPRDSARAFIEDIAQMQADESRLRLSASSGLTIENVQVSSKDDPRAHAIDMIRTLRERQFLNGLVR